VPVLGSPAAVDGKWRVVYSTGDAFRTAPGFWAVEAGLGLTPAAAAAAFRVTDQVTAVDVRQSVYSVDLAGGTLESRVDVSFVPGVRATLVTQCRARPAPPAEVELLVDRVLVARASTPLAPLLERVSVPLRALLELRGGPGASRVSLRIAYLDREILVARSRPRGDLMVLQRVL